MGRGRKGSGGEREGEWGGSEGEGRKEREKEGEGKGREGHLPHGRLQTLAALRQIRVLGIGKMCLVRYILLISIKKRNRLRFSYISDLHFVTFAAYSV